jgi:hypothetical protein
MPALTWSPPPGWASYQSKDIPVTGGTLNLTDGVDYKLIAPNAPITGTVIIKGGRNVVWIGGFIGGRTSQPSLTSSYDSPNRGIRIDPSSGSPNRIIYLEGIMGMSGTYLSDWLQLYASGAPVSGLTLIVQNINLRCWIWGNNVTAPNVHADVIQFYSGPTNFFLDRLTADHCTYQGLYLDSRNYGGTPAGTKLPWEVKHVNLEIETTGGTGKPASQPLGLNGAHPWADVQNTEIYVNGFKPVSGFGNWPIDSELHENAVPPGGDFVTGSDWNTGTYVYTSPGYIGSGNTNCTAQAPLGSGMAYAATVTTTLPTIANPVAQAAFGTGIAYTTPRSADAESASATGAAGDATAPLGNLAFSEAAKGKGYARPPRTPIIGDLSWYTTSLDVGDDLSENVTLPFPINFLGVTRTEAWISSNGYLSFEEFFEYSSVTLAEWTAALIAPFMVDQVLEQSYSGSGTLRWGSQVAGFEGRDVFVVLWDNIGGYEQDAYVGANQNLSGVIGNTYQLVIVDRSDIAPGDFDVLFNYEEINWVYTGDETFLAIGYTDGAGRVHEHETTGSFGMWSESGTYPPVGNLCHLLQDGKSKALIDTALEYVPTTDGTAISVGSKPGRLRFAFRATPLTVSSFPLGAPVLAASGSRPTGLGDGYDNPMQIIGTLTSPGVVTFDQTFLGYQEDEPYVVPYDDADLGQADESAWFDFLPPDQTNTLTISSTDDLYVELGYGATMADWEPAASGYTVAGPVSLLVAPSSPVRIRVRPSGAYLVDGAQRSFTWSLDELEPELIVTVLSPLQRAPGTFRVSIANGLPGATVSFASEALTIPGAELDDTGSLLSFSVSIPSALDAGTYALVVSSPGRTDTTAYYTVVLEPYTSPVAQPDDAAPVPVAPVDGVRRWVLQDPAPSGEEYVFEINPDAATSPHPENVFTTEATTAPDGQLLTWEGAQRAVSWQFRGVLTTQTQHDAFVRFRDLNRRVWLIDNRNRAWVVSIENFDAVPRNGQNPWVHDYTVSAIIYKGPVTPV